MVIDSGLPRHRLEESNTTSRCRRTMELPSLLWSIKHTIVTAVLQYHLGLFSDTGNVIGEERRRASHQDPMPYLQEAKGYKNRTSAPSFATKHQGKARGTDSIVSFE